MFLWRDALKTLCSITWVFLIRGGLHLLNDKFCIFTDIGIAQMTWIYRKLWRIQESWNEKNNATCWHINNLTFNFFTMKNPLCFLGVFEQLRGWIKMFVVLQFFRLVTDIKYLLFKVCLPFFHPREKNSYRFAKYYGSTWSIFYPTPKKHA